MRSSSSSIANFMVVTSFHTHSRGGEAAPTAATPQTTSPYGCTGCGELPFDTAFPLPLPALPEPLAPGAVTEPGAIRSSSSSIFSVMLFMDPPQVRWSCYKCEQGRLG